MKRPVKKFDEYDVVTGWRRLLCYTQRPGVTSGIKRRLRRRERHEAAQAVRSGRADS